MSPLCVSAGGLVLCAICNGLCSAFWPGSPELLAAGTSLAFLVGGCGLYYGFARGEKAVKFPRKQLFFGTLWSLVIGIAAYVVYDRLIVPMDLGKLPLVILCLAVGGILMILYIVLMGNMIPTREILSKLRRGKQVEE